MVFFPCFLSSASFLWIFLVFQAVIMDRFLWMDCLSFVPLHQRRKRVWYCIIWYMWNGQKFLFHTSLIRHRKNWEWGRLEHELLTWGMEDPLNPESFKHSSEPPAFSTWACSIMGHWTRYNDYSRITGLRISYSFKKQQSNSQDNTTQPMTVGLCLQAGCYSSRGETDLGETSVHNSFI